MKSLKNRKAIFIFATFLILLGGTAYFGMRGFRVSIQRTDPIGSVAVADTGQKSPFSSQEAEEHFKKGHELLKKKELDNALSEFEKAAKLSPDSPLAQYWVGMTFFYKKDSERAIAKFKKVLELDPKNFRAMAMIGKILSFDRAKLDEAAKYLNNALSIDPNYEDARFDLGRIYAMRGDMNRAFAEFAIIFNAEPRFALYHFEAGRIFESMKAVDRAKQEYSRALQLDPNMTAAKEALAKLK
jgi:tetratricopeptide (TPR) repeat protein